MAKAEKHISNLSDSLPVTAPASRKVPECVGIIMDGNRRWARERGRTPLAGHRAGYAKLREVASWAREAGVPNLILYAFSTENWNRTKEEVSYLMRLFRFVLGKELPKLRAEGVRVRIIGERGRFPADLRALMHKAETATAHLSGQTLAFALSYGGRAEILSAVNRAVEDGRAVDEASFGGLLWTAGLPDPDLIIRTGSEQRLSGFLPWQGVYSELFFPQTYWPAFSREDFFSILDEFSKRKRNFGK